MRLCVRIHHLSSKEERSATLSSKGEVKVRWWKSKGKRRLGKHDEIANNSTENTTVQIRKEGDGERMACCLLTPLEPCDLVTRSLASRDQAIYLVRSGNMCNELEVDVVVSTPPSCLCARTFTRLVLYQTLKQCKVDLQHNLQSSNVRPRTPNAGNGRGDITAPS